MSQHLHLVFAPLIAAPWLEALAAAATLIIFYALLRGAKAAIGRGLVFTILLLALANPSFIKEQHEPLKDKLLVLVDNNIGMQIGDRLQQQAAALEGLTKKLAAFSDLDVETVQVKPGDSLFAAIKQKLAATPPNRLAGIIALTDGEVTDKPDTPLPAPLHVLIAGHHDEIDRRLIVKQAPAYGIVGKAATITLRVEDQPRPQSDTATVHFTRDKGEGGDLTIPVNKDMPFTLPIEHAGPNRFVFSTPALANELTPLNNAAAVTVNGIRDRLRVLLVSGQPNIGGRTWRNFLKTDPSVDLIHFTILRSPLKQDNVPNSELSLIAFPVHELFGPKLKNFDLVIFAPFRAQSLIPDAYLQNIAAYVENGGALLLSTSTEDDVQGIEYAPLTQSPLSRILPAQPDNKILTGTFVPDLSETGRRHPVTATLEASAPRSQWGPWFRQTSAHAVKGDILMTGIDNQPLLVLDHVGQGRIAQFLSDQSWLWSRGYLGGGPQAELFRRVAHWLVKEPELDETALQAHAENSGGKWQIKVTRQSLHDESASVTLTDPQNQSSALTLTRDKSGILSATVPAPVPGIYHLSAGQGDDRQDIPVMIGLTEGNGFGDMRATDKLLAPAVAASNGSFTWLADQAEGPALRLVGPGASTNGGDWIGLRRNGLYRVTGSKAFPLLPAWALIILALGGIMAVWWHEGRK